ncbi:MAG TPA: ABC transporter ATP-binding protein [Polyangiaceae bacterium]|nr:ABC transporter ATP-binding protein [Polyangiaceae bacterium]
MSDALVIRGLTKTYGRTVALDGLDLRVPKGVICGFIGPNGAGKTTTFGITGGLIRADHGEVDILGKGALSPQAHPGLLTMLPQDCELSPHVSLRQLLTYYARLQGLSAHKAAKDVDARLDEVALTDRAEARIKTLSHGMRRRVAIAQALLGSPSLVLLDEPTSGLDPELVVRMREVFASHRGKRTLVVSSHNLLELEALCDHVIFIQRGRCTREGSMAEVTEQGLVMRYTVENAVDLSALEQAQPELEISWSAKTLVARGSGSWTAANLNATIVPYLLHMNAGLLEIRRGKSLEDAYMAGKAQDDADAEAEARESYDDEDDERDD